MPTRPTPHPLLGLPEAAHKAVASAKQCSGIETTAKAFSKELADIDGKLAAVKKQRKSITPGEWWAAAGLLFFNSSATTGHVDQLGRATNNAEIAKWCEAAGVTNCSEVYRKHWYRPSKESRYTTLCDWISGATDRTPTPRKVRRDALGRIWIDGVECDSQDMQERKALMAEADAQMAAAGR